MATSTARTASVDSRVAKGGTLPLPIQQSATPHRQRAIVPINPQRERSRRIGLRVPDHLPNGTFQVSTTPLPPAVTRPVGGWNGDDIEVTISLGNGGGRSEARCRERVQYVVRCQRRGRGGRSCCSGFGRPGLCWRRRNGALARKTVRIESSSTVEDIDLDAHRFPNSLPIRPPLARRRQRRAVGAAM